MTITLKVSENTKQKMIEYFADKKRPKTPAYAVFQADEADTVVTLYESGKAVFQGVSADIDAAMWKTVEQNLNPGKKIEETNSDKKEKKDKKDVSPEQERFEKKVYQSNSIGSDEVGTGDYFGPIVVTAAYVAKENIPFLEELGVKDSKKLNDEKILEIVPKLIKKIPYYSIVLSNEKYNLHRNEDINMNKMKAILHNQALAHLINEQTNIDYVVVDQFAKPYVYYNYLKDAGNVVRNITFMTKAEDKCLSVACASLISRFIFLKEFRKLEDKVDAFLPKGAGEKVDEVALRLLKKHVIEILNEIAKLNFKNTEKIKQQLN